MNDKLRKRFVPVIFSIILILACSGCKANNRLGQEEESRNRNVKENEQIKADTKEKVYNNGGKYVEVGEVTYYRQENENSYESGGLFGTFAEIAGSEKMFMCIDKEGNKEELFADTGYGPIYYANNTFFLQEISGDENIPYEKRDIVYSIDKKGENKTQLGYGKIEAIDEKEGVLLVSRRLEEGGSELYTICMADGSTKEIVTETSYGVFLRLEDSKVYYQGQNDDDFSVTLNCVHIDGTGEKQLAKVNKVDEFQQEANEVVEVQVLNDTVYFSYGYYGGSLHEFQAGAIMQATSDASEEAEKIRDLSVDGEFLAEQQEDHAILYYRVYRENAKSDMVAYSLKDGKEETVDFKQYEILKPFVVDQGISIYFDEKREETKLLEDVMEPIDESMYGSEEFRKQQLIDLEYVNGTLYYTVQELQYSIEDSIGWRDGYKMLATSVYQYDITSKEQTLLYQYKAKE